MAPRAIRVNPQRNKNKTIISTSSSKFQTGPTEYQSKFQGPTRSNEKNTAELRSHAISVANSRVSKLTGSDNRKRTSEILKSNDDISTLGNTENYSSHLPLEQDTAASSFLPINETGSSDIARRSVTATDSLSTHRASQKRYSCSLQDLCSEI